MGNILNILNIMINIDSILSSDVNELNYNFDKSYVVMMDVLRASSVVITALKNSAKSIIPVAELSQAWELKKANPDYLIAGERDSIKVEGFDLGNSPFEYGENIVKNKSIIFTSTNGAKIFRLGSSANKRVIASFINYEIVLEDIYSYIESEFLSKNEINLFFVCAGTNGKYSREDSVLAGKFINDIKNKYEEVNLSDSSELIQSNYLQNENTLLHYLRKSKHAKTLESLALLDDIDYCFSNLNIRVLPTLTSQNVIVK